MRVTKADLQEVLKQAAEFNQLELLYVALPLVFTISSYRGFVPICQYGRGMLPLRGEYGVCGNQRFLTKEPSILTVSPRPYSRGIVTVGKNRLTGKPRLLRKRPK